MGFLFNKSSGTVIDIPYYDVVFNEASTAVSYDSLAIPGSYDNVSLKGFKLPSGSIKVYVDGSGVVDKVQKLKNLCEIDKSNNIVLLKIKNLPPKDIIVTRINTTYNLSGEQNINKATVTIEFTELKDGLLVPLNNSTGLNNLSNSTLPLDYKKQQTDLEQAKAKVNELSKQVDLLNKKNATPAIPLEDTRPRG